MPQSTIQPDTIELKRIRSTTDGIKLDLLIHWNISQVEIPEEEGGGTQYVYDECEMSIPYKGAKAEITNYLAENEGSLLLKAKAKFEKDEGTEILTVPEKLHLKELQQIAIYGQISDIDATRTDKKYVQIEKTIAGSTIYRWCYVTYSVLKAHQNNDLAIGDYVLIEFVDNDLGKPIVLDKIIQ